MEEKLRPGVFSSYTAGSSGYGSGSRAAGLIVPGVTAPGTPVWVTDGTEAAAALPAPEEAAALAACELLLATGAGRVWLCPVAEEGWQAAFDLAGAEAELDTIVSACEEEADALAFAAMLTAAANDRRERVGIIAAADDEAALALAAAVNCERVMLTAGSGVCPPRYWKGFRRSPRPGVRRRSKPCSGAVWCRRNGWAVRRSASEA